MRAQLLFLFAAILLLGSTAVAQTQWIAHQSHGGAASTFTINGDGNLGDPGFYKIKRITWLSDTVVVELSQFYYWSDEPGHHYYSDTIHNHPIFCNPAITLDSLKRLVPEVELANYAETHRNHNGIFIAPVGGPGGPSGPEWLAIALSLISLLLGWFMWKSALRKLRPLAH